MGDASPSWGVQMCVGRVAGVLEDGGGVDVEVFAAEHQAGPASALLWRLRNLHLALAWLAHHSSLQERIVRDPGVSDQKIPAGDVPAQCHFPVHILAVSHWFGESLNFPILETVFCKLVCNGPHLALTLVLLLPQDLNVNSQSI